ncbi:MAG: hypothetical protein LBU20_01890 [Candidatus Nomurabacteria bacterium]|jgi:uncharacterized protein (TIGR02145 family)|nr:hypothetical protein [Candidatus Nomurabacteria bacterium]
MAVVQATQNITARVIDVLGVPDTGAWGSFGGLIIMAAILMTVGLAAVLLVWNFRITGRFLSLLIVPALALFGVLSPVTLATSALTLANSDIELVYPAGELTEARTKSVASAMTVAVDSVAGYTLAAKLDQVSAQNITVTLDGATLSEDSQEIYSGADSEQEHNLAVTVPAGMSAGVYKFAIVYDLIENATTKNACAAGDKFKGDIGDIRDIGAATAAWTVGDIGLATDIRNNQQYCIGRLADGNIWMLDNLRLGSTDGPITLTNSDSDLKTSASFTLPQLTTSSALDYDNPQTYGPVMGDSGTGETNYGYFYNWSAATAGESRATMPAGAGSAQNSICPHHWQLPVAHYDPIKPNHFQTLNAAMALDSGLITSDQANDPWGSDYDSWYQNWHNDGPFRGVFSGYWDDGFIAQGEIGYLWSRTAAPTYDDSAFYLFISSDRISPTYDIFRSSGLAIRCIYKQ